MVIQSNHDVEVVCWFLEQAWLCSSRFVSVLLAFPEDVGVLQVSGPAITCELHQCVAAFLCELAEQRGPSRLYTNQLAVTQVALTFGLDFTILHRAFLVLRRPTASHLPMHGSSRSSAGNKRARGVPLLFFSTFWQTVLGVVSGLNFAARLSKARFEESSVVPLCRLTSKCWIFFLFLPNVSETADGGITQLIERSIGEESS